MTLSEVLQLLALLGGAVYVTFQISWTIFTHLHKKCPPEAPTLGGHSYDFTEELTVAGQRSL